MGDATPERATTGATAGEDAVPAAEWDAYTIAEEQKFLSGRVLEVLGSFRFHWGDAYQFGMTKGYQFAARRLDGTGGVMASEKPEELRAMVRADYSAWKAASGGERPC
jgi:hypothetical protein